MKQLTIILDGGILGIITYSDLKHEEGIITLSNEYKNLHIGCFHAKYVEIKEDGLYVNINSKEE